VEAWTRQQKLLQLQLRRIHMWTAHIYTYSLLPLFYFGVCVRAAATLSLATSRLSAVYCLLELNVLPFALGVNAI
jgi:hypothetical protein